MSYTDRRRDAPAHRTPNAHAKGAHAPRSGSQTHRSKHVATPASQPSTAHATPPATARAYHHQAYGGAPGTFTHTPQHAARAPAGAPPGGGYATAAPPATAPSPRGAQPTTSAPAAPSPSKQPLGRIGRDIHLTKRMLQHATRLALAKTEHQMEMEKRSLSEVEHAIQEKRLADQSVAAEAAAANPEEFINRERGWWDAEIAGWQDKRERMRHELEKSALEKIIATQTPEQLQELQDPRQATQWLQLMEASLHPFLNELDRTITPPPNTFFAQKQSATSNIRRVPTSHEWQPMETKSGLWNTVPKTTKRFVETRDKTLNRPDWSNKFSQGEVGAVGDATDKFWDPNSSAPQDTSGMSMSTHGGREREPKKTPLSRDTPLAQPPASTKRVSSVLTTPASYKEDYARPHRQHPHPQRPLYRDAAGGGAPAAITTPAAQHSWASALGR